MSNTSNSLGNKNNNLIIGIIIIVIGLILFIRAIFPGFPFFFISWQAILIVIGILYGIKSQFKNPIPYIMIIIGMLSLINGYVIAIPFYRALFLPIIVIGIGIMIIDKDKRRRQFMQDKLNYSQDPSDVPQTPVTYEFQHNNFHESDAHAQQEQQHTHASPDDYININAVFGGNKTVVFSKNVIKADINCLFGGVEINLRQADIKNAVIVDILTICGGVELKVPSNWKIKNEMVAVFGGIDDKRNLYNVTPDENKTIILRGTVLMGGIDIKN